MPVARKLLRSVVGPAAQRSLFLQQRNPAARSHPHGKTQRWHSTSTHFGFAEVPLDEKTAKVKDVFYEVAERYDVMNDLMSGGMHR